MRTGNSSWAESMVEWERRVDLGERRMVFPVALELDSKSNAYLVARESGVFNEPQTTVLSKFSPEGKLVWEFEDSAAYVEGGQIPALVVDEARARIHLVGAGHFRGENYSTFAIWTFSSDGQLLEKNPFQDFRALRGDGYLYWHADAEGHVFAVGMEPC